MSDGYGLTPQQYKEQMTQMLRKHSKPREKSKGEETLAQHLTAYKIPFEREFKFYPLRNWRFDFLLTGTRIAIEVEGGIWKGKGHTGGKHFEEDCIKYSTAAIENWRVLRFSTDQVTSCVAINFIKRIKSLNIVEP